MSTELPVSPAEAARLELARGDLLRVHRALLTVERARWEKARGPIANNSAFLQLVIADPWFEWLRPIAQLVLLIDERASDRKQPLTADEARELYTQARSLLTPNAGGDTFQRLYADAVADFPEMARLAALVQARHSGSE
ncbi:MAG: hypothetical protein IT353_03945 [Gemmatimonadaceae bacterium]|nr:hypothetical protein [Gemmatimonadaceae bacterium]